VTPKLYAALRWGALLGGALAIFETAAYLLVLRGGTPDDYDSLSLFELGLEWLVPFVAALLAARETGERSVGLITGLTSGAIVALVSILYQVVVPVPPTLLPGVSMTDMIGSLAFDTLLTVALGALAGWIGGRWGVGLGRPSKP